MNIPLRDNDIPLVQAPGERAKLQPAPELPCAAAAAAVLREALAGRRAARLERKGSKQGPKETP
jgi:hypothetical protein